MRDIYRYSQQDRIMSDDVVCNWVWKRGR